MVNHFTCWRLIHNSYLGKRLLHRELEMFLHPKDLLFLLGKVDVGAKIKSEYPRSGRSLSRPEHIQYVLETESYLNRILKSMNQRDWSSFESTTVKPVYNLMEPKHIQYVLEKEPYWIGFSIQNRWINVNRSTNLWILWTDNPMVKTF